jgi:hypothetical protein
MLKDIVIIQCHALANPKTRIYPLYKLIRDNRDDLQLTFGVSIIQGAKLDGDMLNNFFVFGSREACA